MEVSNKSIFIVRNRIFGGRETGTKTQNIEIHSGFVAFLVIRDLAQVGGAVENLYNGGIAGLREITHVALENAIFVEDFRVMEVPGGGGPVGGVARTVSDRSTGG